MAEIKKLRKQFIRLLIKYKVSLEFLRINLKSIFKFIKYATQFHIVIKRALIVKNKRSIIKYNNLGKNLISSKKLQNKRKSINELWTDKMVRYLKKQTETENTDVDQDEDVNLYSTDIHCKIKEQLKVLQNFKKSTPSERNKMLNNSERKTDSSKTFFMGNKRFFKKYRTHVKLVEQSQPKVCTSESSENDEYDNARNSNNSGPSNNILIMPQDTKEVNSQNKIQLNRKGKIVDNLINKMAKNSMNAFALHKKSNCGKKNQNNINSDDSDVDFVNTDMEEDSSRNVPEMQQFSDEELIIPDCIAPVTLDVGIGIPDIAEDASSTSSDFLGFQDHELIPTDVPGMLATPLVNNPLRDANQAAFQSEACDKFLSENSRGKSRNIELPKLKSYEEGLVCDGSTPPKMIMPIVPEGLVKSRTVAQKRHYLQKKQNIKYYMIENENTVYRELMKRTRTETPNSNLILYVQNGDVPCTRDCWKATAWLRTENGRFYFQALKVDGEVVKLTGARGNHRHKYIMSQMSAPRRASKEMGCSFVCRQNFDLKNISINLPFDDDEDDEGDVKMILEKSHTPAASPDVKPSICAVVDTKPVCKPGPLSTKYLAAPFEPNLGVPEVYEMPDIHLEVFPQIDQPLDERVKPYLKHILPSECITRQWAEFAVSTLKTRYRKPYSRPKSFTFIVPYLNNQKKLLVRKIYNRKEKLEKLSTDDFEFRKIVDENDEIAEECADVLSEMINSVAIGLSEDSLIQSDPDIDYENNAIKVSSETIKKEVVEKSFKEKHFVGRKKTSRNRLLCELKKLNATVIDAESLYTPESSEKKKCKEPHCRLECICHSLSSQPILRQHCKKIECMFECSCKHSMTSDLSGLMNPTLSAADALLIRKKATAKLAKVEKAFCSTVVLTDRETYLINDPIKEKKRSKRAPKRFDDYDITEKNDLSTDTSDYNWMAPKTRSTNDEFSPPRKLQKITHCDVKLVRLTGLDKIEPWCMIHCLYKCFCKGNTVTGVPFEIKKENFVKDSIIRPQGSFNEPHAARPIEPETILLECDSEQRKIEEKPLVKAVQVNNDSKRVTNDDMGVIRNYRFYINDRCKRVCPIPSKEYIKLNKQRAGAIRKKIQNTENQRMELILNEKVRQSLRYPYRETLSVVPPAPMRIREFNKMRTIAPKPGEPPKAVEQSPLVISQMSDSSSGGELPLKIASVCSLSATPANNLFNPIYSELQALQGSEISTDEFTPTQGDPIPESSSQYTAKQNIAHSWAIQKLNAAVTRTMHSICSIQKKNTKYIPNPVPFTLSSHQWQLFLQAYIEGLVNVWEIRIKRGTFFAATVINLMPIVPEALSVINIKTIQRNKLSLLGQMLNARFINDKTKTLSVLLSGQRHYWRIVGFINSSYDYLNKGGVFKPTPESHPWLSKKINTLCRLLVVRSMQANNMKSNSSAAHTSNINNILQDSNIALSSTAETEGTPATVPKSNLLIRKVSHKEIEGIVIPIAVEKDHKWLLIDLIDDFSHIYIPAWRNFLSHVRIKNAILLTRATKKIVRIGQNNFNTSVFATTDPHKRLYLGPYPIDAPPDVILYQTIGGKMMLREDYEKCYKINRKQSTNGFWLYKKAGKLIFDMHMSALANIKAPIVTLADSGTLINDQEQAENILFYDDTNQKILSGKDENPIETISDESIGKRNDGNLVEEDPLKTNEEEHQKEAEQFLDKEIPSSSELKPRIVKLPTSNSNNGVNTIKFAKLLSVNNANTMYFLKNLAKKPKISGDTQVVSTSSNTSTETSKTAVPPEIPLQPSIPKPTASTSQSWRSLSPPNVNDLGDPKLQTIVKPTENNEEPKKIFIKPMLNQKKQTFILKSSPTGNSTLKQVIIGSKEIQIRPVTSSTVTTSRTITSSTVTALRPVVPSTVIAPRPVAPSTVIAPRLVAPSTVTAPRPVASSAVAASTPATSSTAIASPVTTFTITAPLPIASSTVTALRPVVSSTATVSSTVTCMAIASRPVTTFTITAPRPGPSSTVTGASSVTSTTAITSRPITSITSNILSKCSSEIEIKRVPAVAPQVKPATKNETTISRPFSSNLDKIRLTALSKQKIMERSLEGSSKIQLLRKVPATQSIGKIVLPQLKISSLTQSTPTNPSPVVNSKSIPVEHVRSPSPDSEERTFKTPRPQPIFGYIVSDNPDLSKLIIPTKKVEDVFLLKVSCVRGVMRIQGMNAVHTYLNRDYLVKFQDRYPTKQRLTTKWRFDPLKNSEKVNHPTPVPSNANTNKVLILNKPDECIEDGDIKLSKLKNFTIMRTAPEKPLKVPKEEPPEKRRKIEAGTAASNSIVQPKKTIEKTDVDHSDDQTSDVEFCETQMDTIVISDDDL